ncbi:MAG: hypothetical protein U1E02_11075, partial [Hydrogenophaga sp.]|nr:hypothetical protein [Hydrogenophaga sp.]
IYYSIARYINISIRMNLFKKYPQVNKNTLSQTIGKKQYCTQQKSLVSDKNHSQGSCSVI